MDVLFFILVDIVDDLTKDSSTLMAFAQPTGSLVEGIIDPRITGAKMATFD